MPFKKIICVLGGGDADAAALRTAFGIAKPVEGHVEVLNVRRDPRDAMPMLGEGVSGALVEEIIAAANKENAAQSTAAHTLFDQARLEAGATVATEAPGPGGVTTAWRERTGRPEDVVPAVAMLADLTVFPHMAEDRETASVVMLESALMTSGRPLLIAPPVPPESVGRRIAICWNGSLQAARAVAMSMGLIAKADQVFVLTADTSKTPGHKGEDLAAYLAWHGVKAEVHTVRPKGEAVGAALLRVSAELGTDLVVMGGYSKSRLREMILGGVTHHVLNHAASAVLMAH